jgi:hypothetical protein
LGLADLLARPATATPGTHATPRAKNVLLLFLYGAASQLDLFDPKPDAPDDIRGPFRTLATRLPGVRLSELLPRTASILDRVTLVRSMSHPYPIHGVAYALTGTGTIDIPMELNRHDGRHWPYFGSVLDYLEDVDNPGRAAPVMPRTLHLPWVQSARSTPHQRAGLLSAFLGPRYNPVVAEFQGRALRENTYRPNDPFGGIDPACQFIINDTVLPEDLTLDRLNQRARLTAQLDAARRTLDLSRVGDGLNRSRQLAMAVTTSPQLRSALDVSREPTALRERYGYHLFGQSALVARRLLEAGSRVVSVFWDEFGLSDGTWDTHENQTTRLRDELAPGFDQTFFALMNDLEDRGMLDETLVLVMTEHGRTPEAERRNGNADGRNHWSHCYSCLFAGAGIAKGRVVGVSDRRAAYVNERPVTPKDVLWTIYNLLGVDPHRMIPDRLARPLPLVAEGSVVREMLA